MRGERAAPLAGATYAPADLVKLVQSRIDSAGIVAAANASWHSTVAAQKALGAKLTPLLRSLRQYVLNSFGETSPVLADFGFSAPKTATKTPEHAVVRASPVVTVREAGAPRDGRRSPRPRQSQASRSPCAAQPDAFGTGRRHVAVAGWRLHERRAAEEVSAPGCPVGGRCEIRTIHARIHVGA